MKKKREFMRKNLIYDIGMHLGQDTAYYLSLGHDVIAVDAFPEMIEKASETFAEEVKNGRLRLLNYAMTGSDNDMVTFHISEKSEWNSINQNISTRQNNKAIPIQVPTSTLVSLFDLYGVPYYCKIDVEGFDNTCIQTLAKLSERPAFISCETECFSEFQKVTEDDILATLNSLSSIGYTKYQIDRSGFSVATPPWKIILLIL
jgi:FkbM family methyltransferase